MVLFSQGNKNWFPGLTAGGTRAETSIAADAKSYGTDSANGFLPTYRVAVLLRGNYFSPEYMKSPAEINQQKHAPALGENLTSDHFSYAMLRIDRDGKNGRRQEWRATNRSEAVVLSDRNLGAVAGAGAMSIHVSPGDSWRGSIAFNDNHSEFGTSNVLATAYMADVLAKIQADDLFADDDDDKGNPDNDAAMVHQDATTHVNQK